MRCFVSPVFEPFAAAISVRCSWEQEPGSEPEGLYSFKSFESSIENSLFFGGHPPLSF
jgi:hypothetical protein